MRNLLPICGLMLLLSTSTVVAQCPVGTPIYTSGRTFAESLPATLDAGITITRCVTVPDNASSGGNFVVNLSNPSTVQGDVLTVSQVKSGGNPPFIKSTTFGENATTDFFVFERNSINYVEITGEGAGTITHQFQGKNAGNSTSSRALTVQGSVAPVTWTKLLTYAAAGDAVELHWSVADQVDVEGYEIQRSTGETFETISSVPYRENGSLEVNYTALLEQSESDAYYRVKQLDYAGTFDYSNVIYVPGQQSKTALAIFPNPARDFVRMAVPERVNTVQLISATGQVIRDYPAAAARDGIDVSDLVSGMYLLRTDDSNFAPQRLIVQK